MKAINWFYFGAGLDILAILVALYFVIGDIGSRSGGTNNPTMYKALLAMGAIVGLGFWLKSTGHLGWANLIVWIPGFPLACYALMILAFIIFKPKF